MARDSSPLVVPSFVISKQFCKDCSVAKRVFASFPVFVLYVVLWLNIDHLDSSVTFFPSVLPARHGLSDTDNRSQMDSCPGGRTEYHPSPSRTGLVSGLLFPESEDGSQRMVSNVEKGRSVVTITSGVL